MSNVCGAKRQNKNETCKAPAMQNGKCRVHGGKTPKGIASPNFKTGAHSKYAYLPARLSDKVSEFLKNPEIVELKENIAVIDSRLTELYSQFHQSEPAEVWLNLSVRYSDWQNEIERIEKIKDDDEKAERQKIADRMQAEFADLLKHGASEQLKAERLWSEIIIVTEQRRKLVESESKRLKDSQQFITAEQFFTFVQLMTSIIKENVTDRDAINRISNAFAERKLISARV